MKFAIKGHPTRGKEVIQILESLGGINQMDHTGRYADYFYYISSDDSTIAWTAVQPEYLNVFTLEEFEKEFPFKVGDKIMDCSDNEVGTITDLIYIDNGFFYNIDFVNSGQAFMPSKQLKPYKEMKEERNITLTLDKAKEWYKKGGELREIALQAFTEKELNPLPRSWEEFCRNNPVQVGECWLENCDEIRKKELSTNEARIYKNWIPSRKSAEAHLAMIQLEQLRDCYNNSCNDTNRIAIINNNGNIELYVNPPFNCFLTFKNHLLAREFFSNFKEIIEIAKELI